MLKNEKQQKMPEKKLKQMLDKKTEKMLKNNDTSRTTPTSILIQNYFWKT
jgi:hypothetical protein